MADEGQKTHGIVDFLKIRWETIAKTFHSEPEYNKVYLLGQVNVDEPGHLQQMSDKFHARSKRLTRIAWLMLFIVYIVIGMGVLVFLLPTRFTDIDQAGEDINDAYDDRHDLLLAQAEAQVKYLRSRDLYNLFGLFHEIKKGFENYNPNVQFEESKFYQLRLQYGLDASGQLANSSPAARTYSFKSFQWHTVEGGDVRIPGEVFLDASKSLRGIGLDPQAIHASFESLKAAVGQDTEREAVATIIKELSPLTELYNSADKRQNALFLALSEDEKNRLETVEQLQSYDRRISEILLNVNRHQSDWSDVQPLTTLLTIRVGTVILLLYLTTILLSTYRYTLTLAAFYGARGDAMQLLTFQPEDRLFDVNELETMLPLLSPDDYRIDKESVPYESIGRVVRGGG